MNRRRGPSAPPPAAAAGSVRIIGGRWRGTRLPLVESPGLRPSADRGRETLFNWLQPVLPGARVLDAFAGSGALGLEAVSRGAASALLVERLPAQAEHLQAVVQRLQADAQVEVHAGDVIARLQRSAADGFDLVFVDPPFEAALWQPLLDVLTPWLAREAMLYLESPAHAPFRPGTGWQLHREQASRQAHGALYRREPG